MTNKTGTSMALIVNGLLAAEVMDPNLTPVEVLTKIRESQLRMAEQSHKNTIEEAKNNEKRITSQQPKHTKRKEQANHAASHHNGPRRR